MDVAIISDTHIPSRASAIPEPFEQHIKGADHVIHAGDFDSEGAYSNIEALAPELTAVRGNMDPSLGLPAQNTVTLEGVEFVITHGTGSPTGYEKRLAEAARHHSESADPIGVAGHTHMVLDTEYEGIRLLNPGSVTGASPADRPTMMTATVEGGAISVETHEL